MESNEEVFNKLGLRAEKYARCIDFLSEKINGVCHHQHEHMESIRLALEHRDKTGDLITVSGFDEYGNFHKDWEELKSLKRKELNAYDGPLSIEQKIELMRDFCSNLIMTKNQYLKRVKDSETIVQYAEFLENLNEELGL